MEYLLKLMYYNTDLKQLNYSEEVKSNNNHGYIFENLLSGEKYAVQVTAITATGHAKPSMLSYIYTEPNGM
jgi:endothelial-specific receptor tyrosine kinase